MNVALFRHFYDYHFAMNRTIWVQYIIQLSDEAFLQPVDYAHGSVRNQVVHMMSVDDAWFTEMSGRGVPAWLDPAEFADRAQIRAHWDRVERDIRDYLANLRDDQLTDKPFSEGEDQNLLVWQVLLHVANHGTDHRAQLLRTLNDLGVKTGPQDYIFYVYERQKNNKANEQP